MRRSRQLVAGALGLVVLVLIGGGCGANDGNQEPNATPTIASTGTPATTAPSVDGSLDINEAGAQKLTLPGDWLAAGDGAVWISQTFEIDRIDPGTGEIEAKVTVPEGACEATAFGFGALWTATCEKPGLSRIDPRTNTVTGHLDLAVPTQLDGEGSVGAGEGGIWLAVDGAGCSACRVARVDPQTLRVTAHVRVKVGAAGVRTGSGSVWVTNPRLDIVERIDPHRNAVVGSTKVGDAPRFLAVGAGGVWTIDQQGGTVTRLDLKTGAKRATIRAHLEGLGGDITTGDGAVWARTGTTLLTRIDPGTNTVTQRYGPESGSGAVIVEGDNVWISAHDVPAVWRLPLSQG